MLIAEAVRSNHGYVIELRCVVDMGEQIGFDLLDQFKCR
jgi:hypothetical protein